MTLSTEQRTEVIKNYAINDRDTGSAEVQVAVITARLVYLQTHFATHAKDNHSRRGLLKLVGRRRRLLDYIKRNDVQKYRNLIQKLGLRK
ncbi:MAG: 30S ribosomal protein S15 [Deltaproteobacteria bacterium]|jgi:small subunit ribosomal protein S15|nr:30S ribosomal protein S15 [Deltaproteobacteria bacterium]